jgi:uncharacterized phiE125 gp8 family phage protein
VHKTVLVTPPAAEPITLTEAKSHLNVTGSTKDTEITSLIVTARRILERYLNRAILTQTWKVYADCWMNGMKIPYPRLQSITHVKYYDINGTLQTLNASSYYWTITSDEPGRIVRKYDVTYPELQYGRPDAIEIQFVAGWLATASAPDYGVVPEDIKHAMKLLITNYFEHKGDIVIGSVVNKIPTHITDLVHSYKIYEF